MVKQCLIWKPVKCKNIAGESVLVRIPETIAIHYRGTLVSRILAMPQKAPITFDGAIHLVSEKLIEAFTAGRIGKERGHYCWYTDHFIDWISSLGYHIELTGDEFEFSVLSARIS